MVAEPPGATRSPGRAAASEPSYWGSPLRIQAARPVAAPKSSAEMMMRGSDHRSRGRVACRTTGEVSGAPGADGAWGLLEGAGWAKNPRQPHAEQRLGGRPSARMKRSSGDRSRETWRSALLHPGHRRLIGGAILARRQRLGPGAPARSGPPRGLKPLPAPPPHDTTRWSRPAPVGSPSAPGNRIRGEPWTRPGGGAAAGREPAAGPALASRYSPQS